MGWQIKTNNNDKWSLFSTVTDDNIITFQTQKELINFIALEKVYEGKKKAIETLMTFPYGWNVNDKRIVGNFGESTKQYYDWLNSISLSDTYEEYYKAIDNKLEKLMK